VLATSRFGLVALVQSLLVLIFALSVLRIHNEGNVLLIFLIEALLAIGAVNLGIFLSMFARTEFQAVQFIPIVLVPRSCSAASSFRSPTSRGRSSTCRTCCADLPVYGMRDVMLKGAGSGREACCSTSGWRSSSRWR